MCRRLTPPRAVLEAMPGSEQLPQTTHELDSDGEEVLVLGRERGESTKVMTPGPVTFCGGGEAAAAEDPDGEELELEVSLAAHALHQDPFK